MHSATAKKGLGVIKDAQAMGCHTISEALALYFVATRPGVSIGELSTELSMPMSTASRVLWDLQNKGLVEYGRDSLDRRKRLLYLGEMVPTRSAA